MGGCPGEYIFVSPHIRTVIITVFVWIEGSVWENLLWRRFGVRWWFGQLAWLKMNGDHPTTPRELFVAAAAAAAEAAAANAAAEAAAAAAAAAVAAAAVAAAAAAETESAEAESSAKCRRKSGHI